MLQANQCPRLILRAFILMILMLLLSGSRALSPCRPQLHMRVVSGGGRPLIFSRTCAICSTTLAPLRSFVEARLSSPTARLLSPSSPGAELLRHAQVPRGCSHQSIRCPSVDCPSKRILEGREPVAEARLPKRFVEKVQECGRVFSREYTPTRRTFETECRRRHIDAT